jgi:hypothetical protein
MDWLIQIAEKMLRKHPDRITFLAPLCTFFLTVLVGTGHVVYTLMPIICDIALKKGIRPERPCGVASIASQVGITCSPIAAAVVAFVTISNENGFPISIPGVLMVSIPACLCGLMAAAAASYRRGLDLDKDPQFQKKLQDPQQREYIYGSSATTLDKEIPQSAKNAVFVFLGALAVIVFFAILFSSMVFRTGEISERTITDISQKFITYALGHFHCFEMWFTTYEPTVYSYGTKTFLGISNVIGLEDKIQGVYQEYHQIGQNGYYGISNIFTIFRSLIEDFGESGTYLVMFILGFFSKLSLKNLISRRNIFANQVLITAAYAYLLWSFATSFFAYTSYIATFFVAYFLFMILQKKSEPC